MRYMGYFLSGNESSYKSLKQNSQKLHGVIPTWLQVDKEGKLIKSVNKRELKLLSELEDDLKTIPMVQNYSLKSIVSNQFIANKNKWKYFIEQVKKIFQNYKLKAINIDLEGIKGEYKDLFTGFIAFLSEELSTAGISLGLSIPAKTENHNNSSWTAAYDYKNLGVLADNIIIMAYDYHWAGGPPGPVAPLFWVRDVIDYAIMKIPMHKLYLGIPCYGYDWEIDKEGKRARGLSYSQIIKLKESNNAVIEWDQDSQTPYIKYDKHEIWFENVTSIMKKINLVKQYNLQGAVFWRLGLESPQIWQKL